jgi:hypothetical protein
MAALENFAIITLNHNDFDPMISNHQNHQLEFNSSSQRASCV